MLINKKKNLSFTEFCHSSGSQGKMKKAEKVRKYLDLAQEQKNAVEHECDDDTNCSWFTRNSSQWLGKNTGGIIDQRKDRDYTKHSIADNG